MGSWLIELIRSAVSNVDDWGALILAVLIVAEAVVRLTPTKEDDAFVERVGKWVRRVLDFLRIPNVKKK